MVTVIIGAGPQIGSALASRFSKGGKRVALISRSRKVTREDAPADTVAEFQADATSTRSLDQAFRQVQLWAGDIDTLIYNAASMESEEARELTLNQLTAAMATNLYGAVHSVQQLLPGMLARRRGTILFTGGGLALNPVAGWSSLAIGKAGLRAYAHALHKSVASEGVHVATVTICGIVEKGTLFDPDLIAERYWELHSQLPGSFEPEVIYQPDGSAKDYNEPT
jgi:NAD(P)-dependent dehydrogenase (short-subunit alcohol dehydrogenase family)